MKAIIFARVSSKDQEEGQSIPAQVRRLTEYALKKNFTIEQTFQVTESSSKDTRKQFNQIMAFVKKSKQSYALIIDTIDRLQRSFRETPLLDEFRKQGKLELHFLREGLIVNQQSNSAQLLQWDVGVLFASSYVRQLSDNVKRSQEQCIKNGQWVFSRPPYGYKNVTLPTGQKDVQTNEIQAPFVIKMFELYAQANHSFNTIVTKMREADFPRTAKGKSITVRTVELILNNPFYMGLMRIKGQLHPHRYKQLISEALFNRVQKIMHKRHKSPVQYAGKPILLRGLVRCKKCDGAVSGYIKKEKYVYYSCHNSKRICVKKNVKEEKLLEPIFSALDDLSLSDEQIAKVSRYIEQSEKEEHAEIGRMQREAKEKLQITKERLSKLIDMHVDGKIDAATYRLKLEEYKRTQQNVMLELESYDGNEKEELIAAQEALELTREAKQLFLSSNLDEKQQLLSFFFSNLQLDHENLVLEVREPFKTIATVHDQHLWRG